MNPIDAWLLRHRWPRLKVVRNQDEYPVDNTRMGGHAKLLRRTMFHRLGAYRGGMW